MPTIHEDLETTASQILARLTTLQTTHGATLSAIRVRSLAPQPAADPEDPPTFAGVSLAPSTWELISQIEKLVGEVDHYFRSARETLSGASGRPLDSLATAVARHQGTPATIETAMVNLNANVTSLTAALALRSVTFQWSLLPLK
jgi:hypothetical protein